MTEKYELLERLNGTSIISSREIYIELKAFILADAKKLVCDANRAAELEAISAKLAEACQKIGEMGLYTIGPSNAHRIIYEMARLAQVALAEYQKLHHGGE